MNCYQLILLHITLIGAHSERHSLRYYYTVVLGKGSSLPELTVAGYVDDQLFMNYNSESRQAQPVTGWMPKNEGPEYWKIETQKYKSQETVCRHHARSTVSHSNQTAGIHFLQVIAGCDLRDDGSTTGYYHHGYNGRDFLYLDIAKGIYIPTMNEAQISAQELTSMKLRLDIRRNWLENKCVNELKKLIVCKKEDLVKKGRPEVKVWGCPPTDRITRLQCLVYGFHPRAVDVKWMKNGVDDVPSDEISPILPHPDGTYQIRVSVEVPTREGDTYSCHVDHSSLEETLSVKWEPDNGPSSFVTIGAVIACLVVVAVVIIVGFCLYKKGRHDYKSTSNSDSSSESLSSPKA